MNSGQLSCSGRKDSIELGLSRPISRPQFAEFGPRLANIGRVWSRSSCRCMGIDRLIHMEVLLNKFGAMSQLAFLLRKGGESPTSRGRPHGKGEGVDSSENVRNPQCVPAELLLGRAQGSGFGARSGKTSKARRRRWSWAASKEAALHLDAPCWP